MTDAAERIGEEGAAVMVAPAREEVAPQPATAAATSSPPTCDSCGRAIARELPELPALVLELLDREGPAPSRRIAGALHRRRADVLAALHGLEAQGLARLEQPTASPRSRRWRSDRRGAAQEPRHGAEAVPRGSSPAAWADDGRTPHVVSTVTDRLALSVLVLVAVLALVVGYLLAQRGGRS